MPETYGNSQILHSSGDGGIKGTPDPSAFSQYPAGAFYLPTMPLGGVLNQLIDFALINGLQTFGGGLAPQTGNKHIVVLAGYVTVTSAETGGAISFTCQQSGNNVTIPIDPGGHAVGTFEFSLVTLVDSAGSGFGLKQTSALTAGAATVCYQIYMGA